MKISKNNVVRKFSHKSKINLLDFSTYICYFWHLLGEIFVTKIMGLGITNSSYTFGKLRGNLIHPNSSGRCTPLVYVYFIGISTIFNYVWFNSFNSFYFMPTFMYKGRWSCKRIHYFYNVFCVWDSDIASSYIWSQVQMGK